jgi:hypothetical protein
VAVAGTIFTLVVSVVLCILAARPDLLERLIGPGIRKRTRYLARPRRLFVARSSQLDEDQRVALELHVARICCGVVGLLCGVLSVGSVIVLATK